jgi:subtilisin family serine protease
VINKNIFIILVFVIILVFGIIVVSSASDYKSKVSEYVYKNLEKTNKTRVIIKLKEPSLEKGFIIKSVKTDYDIVQEKRKIKEGVINKFKKEDIKHIFIDEIAVLASADEIKELNLDNNVESVYDDSPIHAFLQDSVPLINATRTWTITLSGLNITGIGETICILDTGINFSHPDLALKNKTGCLIDCINSPSGCFENCSLKDDHGHGTHVAGIVAANNSAKGVAIGANLIGVKILNAAGSGDRSEIYAGLDWCIANADTYNISIISMSVGTDCVQNPQWCYSSYCDDVGIENSIAIRVNNATAHNISVVVAAGNNQNYTSISSPGCIKNVTTVSATDKSDNLDTSYSNRNNMTDLVAPGTSINSTKSTGGYETRTGTSMATPLVAGAFALVREYFRLQNGRVPTPIEIQNALNATGKRIPDVQSNMNYSRINIYAAILYLDLTSPNVSLLSPGNNSKNSSINQTFLCSATDLQLANITFYLWNSTNALVYNSSQNITGTVNSTVFNATNLSFDNYKWNCLAYDVNNNYAFASSNFSFRLGYVTANLTSPANGLITNKNQTYNCSFTSESSHALKNSTFSIWNSSGGLVYNVSQNISGIVNSSSFNYNFTMEGNYSWNCLVYNNNSDNTSADNNYSIRNDITLPEINSITFSVNTTSATVNWNSNENTNSSIFYSTDTINLNFNSSNSSLALNHSFTLTGLTASTIYYYNITNCDNAGNCKVNGTNSFTTSVEAVVPSSGGGGGSSSGGGSTSKTYVVTFEGISGEYIQQLAKNDKIIFNTPDENKINHSLIINEVKNNYVNMTIKSNPINIKLLVGESKKLNLSSPLFYDITVRFNGIVDNKAKITIQVIHEDIAKKEIPKNNTPIEEAVNNNSTINNISGVNIIKMNLWIIGLTLTFLIIFIVVIVFILIIRKKTNAVSKEKSIKEYRDVFQGNIKPN